MAHFSGLIKKLITFIFILSAGWLSVLQAEPGFGDIVDNHCAGKTGFEVLPVFGGINCVMCHNPQDPNNTNEHPTNLAGISYFNLYKDNNYDAFCPTVVTPPNPTCTDVDLDSYAIEGGVCGPIDCNDNNPLVYPGAVELCTDGIDNNCNQLIDLADSTAVMCPVNCTDNDKDGFSIDGGDCGPMDCNDANAAINPAALEICDDQIDNNCSGKVDLADPAVDLANCPLDCTDLDQDGYSIDGGACGPIDCNDADSAINPGAQELCTDQVDNNCNGMIDAADPYCVYMNDEEKLDMLKDRIEQHKYECETTEKMLEKEYELLKEQLSNNDDLYMEEEDDELNESDVDDDDDEDDEEDDDDDDEDEDDDDDDEEKEDD